MSANKKNPTPMEEKQKIKITYKMIIFFILGGCVSWINMWFILIFMEIWSYLSIIFTTIIPCVGIGLKNRLWAYSYILGFSIAGIPFMIFMDLFIGGYTFITTFLIFIIIWLIFWKAWRTIGSIKKEID